MMLMSDMKVLNIFVDMVQQKEQVAHVIEMRSQKKEGEKLGWAGLKLKSEQQEASMSLKKAVMKETMKKITIEGSPVVEHQSNRSTGRQTKKIQ